MEIFPWNSMEFCLVLGMEFHGIPWNVFHGIPWKTFSIEFYEKCSSHGIPWNNWNNFYEKLFPWNI